MKIAPIETATAAPISGHQSRALGAGGCSSRASRGRPGPPPAGRPSAVPNASRARSVRSFRARRARMRSGEDLIVAPPEKAHDPEVAFDPAGQLVRGVRQRPLHRGRGELQPGGNLFHRHSFHMPEREDQAVAGGEPVEERVEATKQIARFHVCGLAVGVEQDLRPVEGQPASRSSFAAARSSAPERRTRTRSSAKRSGRGACRPYETRGGRPLAPHRPPRTASRGPGPTSSTPWARSDARLRRGPIPLRPAANGPDRRRSPPDGSVPAPTKWAAVSGAAA